MPNVLPFSHFKDNVYVHKDGTLPDVLNIGPNMDMSLFDTVPLSSRQATPVATNGSTDKLHDLSLVESNNLAPYMLRWMKVNQELIFASPESEIAIVTLFIALLSDFWSPTMVSKLYSTPPRSKATNHPAFSFGIIVTLCHSVYFHLPELAPDNSTANAHSCRHSPIFDDLFNELGHMLLLFETYSPIVSNGKQLITGNFYTPKSGINVASFSQENLYRIGPNMVNPMNFTLENNPITLKPNISSPSNNSNTLVL
ncbi:hypothetical protein AYI70_g2520 [Smittium culicis]|uniref:Uncharacterized protein n=1 Tax=Smittium culicis TaxID=133412 RepID=A0A1R1Y7V5_9FUNG|nr:hypothetical protein AYI70_g2520 [Smittium culicis]